MTRFHVTAIIAVAAALMAPAVASAQSPMQTATPQGQQIAALDARQMMLLNQQFNMTYLQLQARIASNNRQYYALANIMKAKHETAKNALSNLK